MSRGPAIGTQIFVIFYFFIFGSFFTNYWKIRKKYIFFFGRDIEIFAIFSTLILPIQTHAPKKKLVYAPGGLEEPSPLKNIFLTAYLVFGRRQQIEEIEENGFSAPIEYIENEYVEPAVSGR